MILEMNPKKIAMAVLLVSLIRTPLPLPARESYSLDRCRDLALKNNVAVLNAEIELQAAEQVKKAAFTRYFPTVSATGMAVAFDEPALQLGPMSLLDKLTFGAVTLMQPVFAGGRIVTGNKLAELGRRAGVEKSRLSQNEVLLRTEEQYWQIVSLAEKIKTLDLYDQLLGDLAKQAGDAYGAGIITRNDLLKVEVKQSELHLQRQQLDDGRQLALMAFCQFLGIQYDPQMELSETLKPSVPPPTLFIDSELALPQRAEFSLLELGVRAEKLQLDMKRGELLPQLGLGVSGYYMKMMAGQDQYNLAAFCSLSIPVSHWWSGSHELKEKRLRQQIARNNQRDGGELLRLQMQKTWFELTQSFREIELAEKLVAQSEENLKVNQDSYRQGISLLSDLLDAQAGLQSAHSRLIDARVGNRKKTIQYLIVTGRTDEARRM